MPMISKRPNNREDVDYWRSMVDVVIGILLVVLLAMSLLILGLMDRPLLEEASKYTEVEPSPSATVLPSYSPMPTASPSPTPTPSPSPSPIPVPSYVPPQYIQYIQYIHSSGGDGDGHRTSTPWPTVTPRVTPNVAESEKSAVLVRVFDTETKKLLELEGMGFEVLDTEGRQLAYHVYYPVRKEYKRFETTENGTFYLPEKLLPGDYTLENLTSPKDYDLAENVEFSVEAGYDWDEPFLIDAFMSPCKNHIILSITDAETGRPVPGGEYQIVAIEDVTASDGSIRYRAGDVIETVSCDEDGIAATNDLYLGAFSVYQKVIPFGYARTDMGRPISVVSKPARITVSRLLERTAALITVRDELTLERVPGIPFVLTGFGGRRTDTSSDGNGELRLTNLEKNTDYSFHMPSKTKGYLPDEGHFSFTVDNDGLIEDVAAYRMTVNLRKIRCAFNTVSAILSTPLAGQDIGLFAEDGTVIDQWYSGEDPYEIEGIDPGRYYLTMNGKRMSITVRNTAQVQAFFARHWETADYLVVAGGAALLAGAAVAVFALLRRRQKDKGSSPKPPKARKTRNKR